MNTTTLYVHNDTMDDDGALDYWHEQDLEQVHVESLSDVYGPVAICGLDYDAGTAFREVDPIAFRQSLLDWLDSDYTEVTVSTDDYLDGGDRLDTAIRAALANG